MMLSTVIIVARDASGTVDVLAGPAEYPGLALEQNKAILQGMGYDILAERILPPNHNVKPIQLKPLFADPADDPNNSDELD